MEARGVDDPKTRAVENGGTNGVRRLKQLTQSGT